MRFFATAVKAALAGYVQMALSASLDLDRPNSTVPEAYLFAYFTGNSVAGESIYLAASEGNNALNWTELNGGEPVIKSTMGTKGLRDPFICRSPDGSTFYLLATDLSIGSGTSWADAQATGSRYIEVWESQDLVNWGTQRHVLVAPKTAGNVWAPEAVWDASKGVWAVFWASNLYQEGDTYHKGETYERQMVATTTDFVTFSKPKLWVDVKDTSRIDATMLRVDDVYYRFSKDEGGGSTGCIDVLQERLKPGADVMSPLDPAVWIEVDSCIGRKAKAKAVEGPTAFRANPGDVNGGKFYLFVDEYGGRGYIPLETEDIAAPNWKVPESHKLPKSPRHGTVLPITAAELAAVKKAYKHQEI